MKRKWTLFLCLGSAVWIQPVEGHAKAVKPRSPRAALENKLKNELPRILCRPNQYFTTCFDFSPERCEQAVKVDVDKCLTEDKSRRSSMAKGASAVDALRIGECVGERLKRRTPANALNQELCIQSARWR